MSSGRSGWSSGQKMNKQPIYFMLFEKANLSRIRGLMEAMWRHPDFKPVFVKGFDYKEYCGEIKAMEPIGFETFDLNSWLDERGDSREIQWPDVVGKNPQQRLLNALIDTDEFRTVYRLYRLHRQAMMEFFHCHRPSIVVLPEDTDYIRGRLACQLLQDSACIRVIMQPNYYAYHVSYPLLGSRLGDYYLPTTALLEDRLRARGVSSDKIRLFGCPELEKFCRLERAGNAKVFLYVLQGLAGEAAMLKEVLTVFAERFPELDVVVKPHPECPPDRTIEALIAAFDNASFTSPGQGVETLLCQVAAVLAQSSSVLFQALAAGVPIIALNYSGHASGLGIPGNVLDCCEVSTRDALTGLVRRIQRGTYPVHGRDWLLPRKDSLGATLAFFESLLWEIRCPKPH